MKIFVPASTGSDSSYLLYRVLSDYDGEVVARIIRFDATIEDMENVRHVHAWLLGILISDMQNMKKWFMKNKRLRVRSITMG